MQTDEILSTDDFSFNNTIDHTGPLWATAVYKPYASRAPLMVVQCGYMGNHSLVAYSARRMAQRGYFCLSVDIRGRGRSKGKVDDGGLEIMDIYDGIQAAIQRHPDRIDPKRISIVGYSNGGANAFFAAARFPYLFRGAMSFFGIPDYGMFALRNTNYTARTTAAVGGTLTQIPDKYLVRNATLAASNLCGTRFHLACDTEEQMCPMYLQETFIDAVKKVNDPNMVLHLSKPGDIHRWLHGYNNGYLNPAEDAFMDDIEAIETPSQPMQPTGELTVLGFIVTPKFSIVLGTGDDAAARVRYAFTATGASFAFTPMTSNANVRAVLLFSLETAEKSWDVFVNNAKNATIPRGTKRSAEATLDATIDFKIAVD